MNCWKVTANDNLKTFKTAFCNNLSEQKVSIPMMQTGSKYGHVNHKYFQKQLRNLYNNIILTKDISVKVKYDNFQKKSQQICHPRW